MAHYNMFTELGKMTCLEELVIKGRHRAWPKIRTPVRIPSLKTLSVEFYLLPIIRAPSLESLYLDYLPQNTRAIPIVETFLRGVSHLKTLAFDSNDWSFLDYTPELEHVIIFGAFWEPFALEFLFTRQRFF